MDPATGEMTLRDYAAVVNRRKWIVVVAVAAAALVALVLSSLQTPIYSASSEVLVQPRGQDGLFSDQVLNLNERTIQTEIQVIEGQAVRERVQRDLGLDSPPPDVDASAVGDTDVISVNVRDANAANAATYANAYATAYIDVRREQAVAQLLAASTEVQAAIDDLQAEIDGLPDDDPRRIPLANQLSNFTTTLDQLRVDAALRTGGAAIIKSAETPTSPVEPTPVRTVTLAAIVGLLIGLGAAFLVDYLDDKIRTEDDLERVTDRPVLAVVPIDPPPDDRPIALSEPSHTAVESFRSLRTNLQFLGLDSSVKVVQVTSSMAAEGKTTTASNLAVVLAQAGLHVALVDADLRRPRLHDVFAVPQSPGLTDLLLGLQPRDVVQYVDIGTEHRISLYPSGRVPSNPSEILSSRRAHHLFLQMGEHYDYVVIDSAPVLPVSDSVALSGSVGGVLLVVQSGRVGLKHVAESMERLEQVNAPVIGTVLNRVTEQSAGTYAYAGYGGYTPRDDVARLDDRNATRSSNADLEFTGGNPAPDRLPEDALADDPVASEVRPTDGKGAASAQWPDPAGTQESSPTRS